VFCSRRCLSTDGSRRFLLTEMTFAWDRFPSMVTVNGNCLVWHWLKVDVRQDSFCSRFRRTLPKNFTLGGTAESKTEDISPKDAKNRPILIFSYGTPRSLFCLYWNYLGDLRWGAEVEERKWGNDGKEWEAKIVPKSVLRIDSPDYNAENIIIFLSYSYCDCLYTRNLHKLS